MKISIFSLYVDDKVREGIFKSKIDAYSHFKNLGVECADINECSLETPDLHAYCQGSRAVGIEPSSFVADKTDIASFDIRERKKNIEVIKEYMLQMAEEGIKLLMPAPPVAQVENANEFERQRNVLKEALSELAEFGKELGITVAIENQSAHTRPDSKIKDVEFLLENVEGLKYILDSGNFFCVGEDVLAAYDRLRKYLVHVHLKDWVYNNFGAFVREFMPRFNGIEIGTGVIPISKLIEKLKRDSYSGSLVLEINKRKIKLSEFENSLEFIKGEIYA